MVTSKSWAVRAAAVAAAIALGAWVSGLVWPHWREMRAHAPVVRHLPVAPAPIHNPPAPDQQVSLFGTDASSSPHRLRLVLVSTSPGSALAESTATLGTDARNPQVYAGGALLSNGARIVDIRPDRITLALRGRKTTLHVEPGATNRAALESALGARPMASPLDAGDPASVGAADDASAQLADEPSSREDLSDWLRPQPVFENGEVAGILVFTGANPSRLASLGLESGDVIRAIGGLPVRSEAAWPELDDVLSAGGSLVVEVERKGSRLSVSMDGARLADDIGRSVEHP
jgi:type II secretory pathway component PulC